MLNGTEFAYPYFLYLLLLIPVMLFWYWKKNKKATPDVTYSSLKKFERINPTLRERLVHLPAVLRAAAAAFLIIALARPQSFSSVENVYTEGIDIAILLDISTSMLAMDLQPNRLEAAKDEVSEFLYGRRTDKIGLVVFAGQSFTQCPLTIDYTVLRTLLQDVKTRMIEDGTAIGMAIANGVNRLKDSEAESKVMILLTDGENNAGQIDPVTAAQIAEKYGIKIYTIGVGTKGQARYPFQTPFGTDYRMVPVEIDEELLTQIADITGGKYFRATDNRRLRAIYDEIDQLETTKVEVSSYRQSKEHFYNWAGIGFMLLLLEMTLVRTYLRRLP